MLAKEVKRIIRQVIEKGCRNLGFHRTKLGGLDWYQPVDDHYFAITFRTPRAWNRHWGGFLECKLSIRDHMNPRQAWHRKPLEYLINSLACEADREAMRRWYNEAASMTTNPIMAPEDLTTLERELCEMLRIPLLFGFTISSLHFQRH